MTRLLFDIGGTTMRMAAGEYATISQVHRIPTPSNPQDAVDYLAQYVRETMSACLDAVGGIAGLIEDGVVRASPHLPSWDGFPFSARLRDALSIPCQIQNDAELAGLGEAVYGAGKGYGLVAYLGIGTGIGGSLIIDGKVAPHAHGFEPGHQILDAEQGMSFEGLVSGHALEARFGMPAKELPRNVYDELTRTLATGAYNLLLEWSPDILVLGGSLMNEENGYRVADVSRALAALPMVLPLPVITHAALGDDCALYGALAVPHTL